MTIATQKDPPQEPRNSGMEAFVNWIRLNVVTCAGGLFIKRRNAFGRRILPAANWFFRVCRVPVFFWLDTKAWQRWEIATFRMLNPQFEAYPLGHDTVCEEQLPGESLWVHLRRGTLKLPMILAAGSEFRRAHGHWSEMHDSHWSHGDAATRNVLYDTATGRARLIDFEVIHHSSIPAATRQADDLMAFLLDLAAFLPSRRWLPYALGFLSAHGDAAVIAEVRCRLFVPRGTAWIWWKNRTHFVQQGKVARRLEKLARAIDYGALAGSAPATAADRQR